MADGITDKQVHRLKTWTDYWLALETGAKTFEVRRNDRGFQPGDTLILQEWNQRSEEYTGRELRRRIIYVLRDAEKFGLRDGFVVLGLANVKPAEPPSGITDEMVERAAEQIYGGPKHRYKAEDGGDLVEYTVAWNEVTEKLGIEERVVYLRQARRILAAALAGREVDDLTRSDDAAALPGDTPQQSAKGGDHRGVSNPSNVGGVQ